MTSKPRFTRRAVLAGSGAAVASPYIWTSAQAQAGGAIKIGMPAALDRPARHCRPADQARRRVLRQGAERKGRHPRAQDRAAHRGYGRQSRHLRAQGAGDGRAARSAACSPASRCRRRRWRWCRSSPSGTPSSSRGINGDGRLTAESFVPNFFRANISGPMGARAVSLYLRRGQSSTASMRSGSTTPGATTASRCSRTR